MEEIKKADKKIDVEEAFNRYKETLPATVMDTKELITIEREWFEENLQKYQMLREAKGKLLDEKDFQRIGNSDFIKKSGVKKLQNAFHISVDIISTEIKQLVWIQGVDKSTPSKGREIIVMVKARARRPKFRIMKKGVILESIDETVEAVGACSNKELLDNKHQAYSFHNIVATAETRATGRAVMNLIKGDVTLDEMV